MCCDLSTNYVFSTGYAWSSLFPNPHHHTDGTWRGPLLYKVPNQSHSSLATSKRMGLQIQTSFQFCYLGCMRWVQWIILWMSGRS
jgi:hypothetical protein